MPLLIDEPVGIRAAGTVPKKIDEYAGLASTGDGRVSVARMRSPAGWSEPGQRPEFLEISIVLEGVLHVEHEDGLIKASAGMTVIAEHGEWIRYSSPERGGADYLSVCVPAFSPETVNRDEQA